MHPLAYMDQLAAKLRPGQSGLVALDWFNGNRSVLMDYGLRGSIFGLTLQTKPEEIYRCLLEATAFGARRIFEDYNAAGVTIEQVYAVGGLARKSPVTMQIYADVLGMPVVVPSTSNSSSTGACVCAAVALEYGMGTLEAFAQVSRRMIHYDKHVYEPVADHVAVYNELYDVFREVHDFMGIHSNVCRRLNRLHERNH